MSADGLKKVAESFDRARAFELGFAKAAADYGVSPEEYQQLCKIAAEHFAKTAADFSVASANSPTEDAFRKRMASLSGASGKEATKNDQFIAQKKQQVKAPKKPVAPTPPPPAPNPLTYNPFQ